MIVDRHVGTLRIRASSDERARHAAISLEDALRTATIPGASGARVVVIRQLDVGMLAGAASEAGLTLAVEVAAQRLMASAVHGESPNASAAPAVYFRDGTEALVALARRLGRGNASAEWFWPLIVRGWSAAGRPESLAALLLDRAVAGAMGAAAAALIVAAFVAAGGESLVLAPLTGERGGALLAASGWSGMNELPTIRTTRITAVPQLPAATRALIAQWMVRWGGSRDSRSAWLAGMLLVAERPTRATSVALPEIVHALLASIVEEERAGAAKQLASGASVASASAAASVAVAVSAGRPRSGDDLRIDASKRWGVGETSGVDSVSGGAPAPTDRSTPRSRTASTSTPRPNHTPRAPLPDSHWSTPHRTPHAGLLFLVPLLTRLGIVDLLAERTDLAERDWPEGMLLRLAHRLGIPADDPALAWLRTEGLVVTPANRAVTATWMRAVRSRARRDTGRSLAAIVRRNGAIAMTQTHIDVFLRHVGVDVAVRRAGLDIDPGWVPWLGRVIQFHYVDAIPDGSS